MTYYPSRTDRMKVQLHGRVTHRRTGAVVILQEPLPMNDRRNSTANRVRRTIPMRLATIFGAVALSGVCVTFILPNEVSGKVGSAVRVVTTPVSNAAATAYDAIPSGKDVSRSIRTSIYNFFDQFMHEPQPDPNVLNKRRAAPAAMPRQPERKNIVVVTKQATPTAPMAVVSAPISEQMRAATAAPVKTANADTNAPVVGSNAPMVPKPVKTVPVPGIGYKF